MTDIAYDTRSLIGRTAIDPSGAKIGTVADIYTDDETNQPEWLAVTGGMFGKKTSFVPLAGAESSGDDVMIGYDKELVKDAPKAEADGHLSPEEEDALYAHYGQPVSIGGQTAAWSDRDVSSGEVTGRTDGTKGRDTSGPETDDAMTRSEEEIDVNKRTRQAGKVRLRKWIETEDVQMRVPVRREKAKLVTEPITEGNADQAMSGADLTTEEHEVVLSEEVIDVNKRVVPKERVRLETESETHDVDVDEQVRKERIQMDQDADVDRR